jgi:photosystem II stability/assembly factor-like uncharacterized protein
MSDYLDRVEAQLRELTEHGAHQRPRLGRAGLAGRGAGPAGRGARAPRPPRPPRRRSEALAFLAAFAVAAAVVVIVVGNVHTGKPHPTAATAPAQSTTTTTTATTTGRTQTTPPAATSVPVPAHFAPQSFTAIGELTWWLLGPAPCTAAGATAPCGAILRTTDGGRNFTGVPAPQAVLVTSTGAPSATGAPSSYSQLRFADAHNGFAYGPDLYVTHDGGASWHAVDLGGVVTELAISAGEVYATVESAQGGGRLMHSPANRDAWSTVSAAGAVSGGLWVQDSQVIVQSGVGTGPGMNVLVSSDGGQSFSAHPAPSPGMPCEFAAPEPPVVWAHCATGTESGVWRSTDNGAHFTIAAGTGTSLGLPNSAAFAAASSTTAVVGYQPLYQSSNAGVLWHRVGPTGITQWAELGFTDATHGEGLGYLGTVAPANERLYYTIDGGQSYHLVPLP